MVCRKKKYFFVCGSLEKANIEGVLKSKFIQKNI